MFTSNGERRDYYPNKKLRKDQVQELDSWLNRIEKDWRRVELPKVIAREDGAFEASIQSGTYFPDINP